MVDVYGGDWNPIENSRFQLIIGTFKIFWIRNVTFKCTMKTETWPEPLKSLLCSVIAGAKTRKSRNFSLQESSVPKYPKILI